MPHPMASGVLSPLLPEDKPENGFSKPLPASCFSAHFTLWWGGGLSGLTAEGSKPHILEHKDAETLQS